MPDVLLQAAEIRGREDFLLDRREADSREKRRRKILLAYDLDKQSFAWTYPQVGHARSSGRNHDDGHGPGLFFGDDAQSFEAVDARTGKPLWHFNTGQDFSASPMSYAVLDKQYVAVAAGSDIFSFALP